MRSSDRPRPDGIKVKRSVRYLVEHSRSSRPTDLKTLDSRVGVFQILVEPVSLSDKLMKAMSRSMKACKSVTTTSEVNVHAAPTDGI